MYGRVADATSSGVFSAGGTGSFTAAHDLLDS
jgi:hypothetical protein